MYYFAATLHTLGVYVSDQLSNRLKAQDSTDRGSVTIEQVVWAVAVIGIVGIVVVAITNYVTTKSGLIK